MEGEKSGTVPRAFKNRVEGRPTLCACNLPAKLSVVGRRNIHMFQSYVCMCVCLLYARWGNDHSSRVEGDLIWNRNRE